MTSLGGNPVMEGGSSGFRLWRPDVGVRLHRCGPCAIRRHARPARGCRPGCGDSQAAEPAGGGRYVSFLAGTRHPPIPPAALCFDRQGSDRRWRDPFSLCRGGRAGGGQAGGGISRPRPDRPCASATPLHRRARLRVEWGAVGADRRYDLWVLGPNGFHRHFMGHRDDPELLSWLVWRTTTTEMILLLFAWHRTHKLIAQAERFSVTPLNRNSA